MGRITITKIALIAAVVVFSGIAVACTGASSQARPVNPARPTPASPPPGSRIQTVDDAIASAAGFIAGQRGSMLVAERIQSVAYVQTTVGRAAALIGVANRESGVPSNTTAWLFAAQGYYAQISHVGTPSTTQTTLWVLAIQRGVAQPYGVDEPFITASARDLAQLGTPTVISPGQVPQIDAVRAPLAPAGSPTITVGAPSLVSTKVNIPVSTTGSGLSAYTAFEVHLRWNPAVFSFSSANSTGSVLPGSLLCPGAAPDADGGGAVFACTTLGGASTTSAGLLATFVLTPAGTGCSTLHLFTYGGVDGGNTATGTFTLDAASGAQQIVATADGTSNQSGQGC